MKFYARSKPQTSKPENRQPSMNLDELAQSFRQGDTQAIEQLYQAAYPYTADFILTNDGTAHDARRCFRRALSILFRQLNEGTVPPLSCKIETYVYALTRGLWLLELKRRGRAVIDLDVQQPESQLPNIPETVLQVPALPDPPSGEVAAAMDKLKPEYKRFLIWYYFYKLSLAEIADWMDYSESFARVKKKRCLEELKRILNSGGENTEGQ